MFFLLRADKVGHKFLFNLPFTQKLAIGKSLSCQKYVFFQTILPIR